MTSWGDDILKILEGLVMDGTGEGWVVGLNVKGFVGIFVVGIYGLDFLWGQLLDDPLVLMKESLMEFEMN